MLKIKRGRSSIEVKPDRDAPSLMLEIIMCRKGSELQRRVSITRPDAKILVDKINEWLNSHGI